MKFKKYINPYLLFVILAPLLMMVEVFMDLSQPTLMADIVDKGILAMSDGKVVGDMQVILTTAVKMLIFAIIGMAGGMGCTYFSSKASQNFGADLRADLFKKIHSFSFSETDKFSTGSLITRITNDVTQLQNLLMMSLRMFVRAPFMFIGGVIMALSINFKFGIILAITLPILFVLILLIIKIATPFFKIMQEKIDNLNNVLQENLSGVRVVKAFVREKHEIKRFEEKNDDLTDTSLKIMRLMTVINPIMMFIMNATVIAVIYMGAYEVEASILEVGQVMAVITYITQALMSMMMMSMLFISIPRAKASAQRIKEVMETEPVINDGKTSDLNINTGKIEFKNVSFRYPSAVGEPILKNINLVIEPGEFLAFLGSTGAGKSSLVNLIPRFYDATEGDIYVDGKNVKDFPLENLRKSIGIVLQESVLFTGNLMDNIKWGKPDADDEEAIEAAKTAQANEYITSFKESYKTMLGQGGLSLSGGQKQRLSIARALIRKPKILIMDDSTSALDLGTESRLQAALKEKMQGMTSLVIAQRISSVMYADRIVVLEKGSISAIGTHEQLMETSDIYKDIYNSQVGQGGLENE